MLVRGSTIAIFDVLEPSDTGKELVEFNTDMRHLGERGICLTNKHGEVLLHKPFLKGPLSGCRGKVIMFCSPLSPM
jgi:hypothetical protein